MKSISKKLGTLFLLSASIVANAALIPVNGSALINDTTYKLMWVADGNLMATQASSYPGGSAAYVSAVIAASSGVVLDPVRPNTYTLTAPDFDSSTGAMSMYGALAWVNYLNATSYQGYADWRLPQVALNTMSSIGTPNGNSGNPAISSSEFAELFYGQLGQVANSNIQSTHNSNYALFNNVQSIYFFGSVYSSIPPRVWLFDTTIGDQRGFGLTTAHAMAVRSTLVALSPGILNFGLQLVGSASTPRTVTVTNTSSDPFAVDQLTAFGPDYRLANTCGASLPPAAFCTIDVTLTPMVAGAQPGRLSIRSGNLIFDVALVGVGTDPVTMTVSDARVTAGVPVTLTWTASSGASCLASGGSAGDGWSGSLAVAGTKSVSESAAGSYTYTVSCTVGSQTSTAQATVTTTMPTATLSATPTSATKGQNVTLQWSSTNADSCSASGGSASDGWTGTKALSGTAAITEPSAGTITYTITCSSAPQSTSASAQVIVTAPSSGGGGGLDLSSLILLLGSLGASRCLAATRRTAADRVRSEPTF